MAFAYRCPESNSDSVYGQRLESSVAESAHIITPTAALERTAVLFIGVSEAKTRTINLRAVVPSLAGRY